MELPGVFGSMAPFLEQYGYFALAFVLLVDNLGVPLPGEAVLVTAAVFAGAGELDVRAILVIALVAAVFGSNGSYLLGRFGGRPLVEHLGRRIGVTPARLDRIEHFFGRYGARVVLVARFVPLLRQFYGIAAGTCEMPWWKFLAANAAGAALWIAFWTTVGLRASDYLEAVNTALTRGGPVVLAALLPVLLFGLRRRRRRSRPQPVAPSISQDLTGSSH